MKLCIMSTTPNVNAEMLSFIYRHMDKCRVSVFVERYALRVWDGVLQRNGSYSEALMREGEEGLIPSLSPLPKLRQNTD